MFFKKEGANSASGITKFSKSVEIELEKKEVPTPINRSLEKNPQKILPKAKNIKGTIIRIGASWAFSR